MSDPVQPAPASPDLRLRAEPPRVTRLSRRALGVIGGIAGLGVGALLIYGLQGRDDGRPDELYNTDSHAADAIANGPSGYDDVPQLGPPLPGDLGRPIVKAQERGEPVPMPGQQTDPIAQEREAARASGLFVGVSGERAEVKSIELTPVDSAVHGAHDASPSVGLGADPNTQDRAHAFLDAAADRRTVSDERLIDPASPYVLQAGSVISAALITGIHSDLPGQVTAQVTAHVYDTLTGRHLLIPQGSRLIGLYDSEVSFGQSRVLLVWTRLILPNGRSIVLERLPTADTEGYAGLEDDVDHHWGRMFMAAGLSTLLGVGFELGSDNEDDIASAIRESGQGTVGRTGEDIVRRQLDVAPTLTVRVGFPVRVIVNRDLVLAPYGEGASR